jgi:hypothetical protein
MIISEDDGEMRLGGDLSKRYVPVATEAYTEPAPASEKQAGREPSVSGVGDKVLSETGQVPYIFIFEVVGFDERLPIALDSARFLKKTISFDDLFHYA